PLPAPAAVSKLGLCTRFCLPTDADTNNGPIVKSGAGRDAINTWARACPGTALSNRSARPEPPRSRRLLPRCDARRVPEPPNSEIRRTVIAKVDVAGCLIPERPPSRLIARSAKLVGTTERLLHRPQSEGVRLLLGPACPPGLAKQGRCRSAPRVCATQHTLLPDIREIGARGLPIALRISRRDWAKSTATA